MNQLLKRGFFGGILGYTAYDLMSEEQLILRGARTLGVGIIILYNYKIRFDENNTDIIHEDTASAIYNLCRKNDGLYVKFGQQIAASEHVLPPIYLKYFTQLQDQANESHPKKIQKLMEEELGGQEKIDEIFSEFDPKPVAAASIAQVHRAKLKDGTPVAVKIQKTNIKRQFQSDMFAHWLFCFVLEHSFDLPLLSFQQTIEDNMAKEIDFNIEMQNALRITSDLEQLYKNSSSYNKQVQKVYVPKMYPQYCSKRLMVMEWIDGIKITDVEKLEENNFNVYNLLKTCIDTFSEQIFVTGFVHCDPHPGNIMARQVPSLSSPNKQEQQIILLDFGLCIPLREEFRLQYCKFWESLFMQDKQSMKDVVKNWGIEDEEMFASAQLMRPYNKDKHINEKITKKEVYQMQLKFKDDFRKMLADTTKFPDEIIFIGRNMNLVRSLNKRLGSVINRVNVMATYAVEGQSYKNNRINEKEVIIQKNRSNYQKNWNQIYFSCRLFLSGIFYKCLQFYLKVTKQQNFEEAVDQQIKLMMEERYRQYGMKPADETTFNA